MTKIIVVIVYDNEYNLKQLFLLNDSSETNKTFVQNIVMNKLRFEKIIVFVVISFDITIILLNDNSIAHVRFKENYILMFIIFVIYSKNLIDSCLYKKLNCFFETNRSCNENITC